ncbi:glycosyltransferase family 2 protein [Bacillus suaedaesalsae]|uniref:Glycosyltransferase family 2 protein n=1 Tax=Bacillus suaedaesalsae TaxID=2810349 RepID=A0ABS2DJQ0_9BACI|nr:glycosyltransferase family A protein [Bacillus suaedaesalsae]MBM6618240.1 glycosyltransferase family 2 protein [Bacillus suaedaesalsae]
MPKVSVIIPCFNYGKYIDQAVKSVLNQTFQDFEIIIINDGSTDKYTNILLKQYKKPKTRVIFTENQGPSIARNIGIREAKGKYILPLDADDKIGRTYLEKAVDLLENNKNLGIVYCEAEFFGSRRGKWDLPEYSFETIILDNVIFNSAFFRKKDWEKVGGYNSNMIHGMEDYDFWLSLIELGVSVYRIPEVLFFYRIKAKSRSTNLVNHNTEMFEQIFRNHQNLFIKNIRILIENRVSPKQSAQIFVDTGNGFNDKERIVLNSFNHFMSNFELNFDLSKFNRILGVRFDPVEGKWCRVRINEIIYEENDGKILSADINQVNSNGIKQKNNYTLFHTSDPMFFIPIKGNIKSVYISGNIELIDYYYIDKILSHKDEVINQQATLIEKYKSSFGPL